MLKNLYKKINNYHKPVIGIAVSAWTRTGPAFLLPNYNIICLLETADLDAIREKCPVYSFSKDFGIDPNELEKKNTYRILKQKSVQEFISKLKLESGTDEVGLLVYKSSSKVEKIAEKLGIKILSSQSSIRDPFEDKKEFRVLGKKAGLNLIPGETFKIEQFDRGKYQQLIDKYGRELVFQLPDYKIGGGIGTFFVNNEKDRKDMLGYIKRRKEKGKKLVWLNAAKFVKGMGASICGCVAKNRVLCGLVQTQLLDVEEARAFKGRNGVWVGHDWGWKKFPEWVQMKAERIAQKLGKFMAGKGYQGMFGIDLVIDKDNKKIWPVECNARYTGGFPAYSMMQRLYNEPSFDFFHLAEFLGIDYKINFDKLQKMYRRPKKSSHLVLHNQERKWVKVNGNLAGGIYRLLKGKLVYQRPGFSLQDLQKKDEFCLVDRAPVQGDSLKPGERLVRILFKENIALSSNKINDWASAVCKKVYQEYRLRETK